MDKEEIYLVLRSIEPLRFKNREAALKACLEGLQNAISSNSYLAVCQFYAELGALYYDLDRLPDSVDCFDTAHKCSVDLSEEKDDLIGKIHLGFARLASERGDFATAEAEAKKALSLIKKETHEILYAGGLTVMSRIHYDVGNITEALMVAKEACDIARGSYFEPKALFFLGLMLYYSVQRNHALEILKQAYNLANAYEHKYTSVACLNWISRTLMKLGMQEEAIRYVHRALEKSEEAGDSYEKANSLNIIGQIYFHSQNFQKANFYLKQSVELFQALGFPTAAARIYPIIVIADVKLNDLLSAGNHLDAALQLEAQMTIEAQNNYHEACSLFFSASNDFANAYRHLVKHMYLKEQMREKEYSVQLISERLIERERASVEIQKIHIKTLEDKVNIHANQMVAQTDLISKFRDELREITRKYLSDNPGMREVKEKLKELPCKQIDWEKFEAEFAAVHPEFSKKLYERYASLTPMEVKMCSLLRLNLKSHKIARLFCVTERAVEFHRLNIRKKCGIPKEQSLSVFLNNL